MVLLFQILTQIVVAEWGDRSQITTAMLSASNSIYPIFIGSILVNIFLESFRNIKQFLNIKNIGSVYLHSACSNRRKLSFLKSARIICKA